MWNAWAMRMERACCLRGWNIECRVFTLACLSERSSGLASFNTLASTAGLWKLLLDGVSGAAYTSVINFQSEEACGYHFLEALLCDVQRAC
jgi:hypothetical protein